MALNNCDEKQKSLILVDGATGYLGNHLVSRLKGNGWRVRCLFRKNSSKQDVEFLSSLTDDLMEIDFSILDEQKAARIFDSVTHLVHLIGSIAPKRGETLTELHENYTDKMVSYSIENKLQKIIHVTALGAGPDARSNYHRTKWKAEEVVIKSGLDYTILRPSLIIGREAGFRDSKLVKRLLNFILKKAYVPLINGGRNKVQPIYVGDAAAAIEAALSEGAGKIFDLGGPEPVEMRELVERLASHLDKKVKILPLNAYLGFLVAGCMEAIQEVPTLSSDQVVLSLTDNICQENHFEKLVGRPPLSLDQSISTYQDVYIRSL